MPRDVPQEGASAGGQVAGGRHFLRPRGQGSRPGEGVISFDHVGKAPGRGAYICRRAECLNKAMKIRALERQLECAIAPEVFEQLRQELELAEAQP